LCIYLQEMHRRYIFFRNFAVKSFLKEDYGTRRKKYDRISGGSGK